MAISLHCLLYRFSHVLGLLNYQWAGPVRRLKIIWEVIIIRDEEASGDSLLK